jgi:hypothetical protein
MSDTSPQTVDRRPRKTSAAPRLRLGAVVAVALVIAFVAWLAIRDNGKSNGTAAPHKTVAAISAKGLTTLAASLGTPIYWAGPSANVRYELTQTTGGRYFVRYLPQGAAVGSGTPYLFIATFPMTNAFAATAKVANRSGSVKIPMSGGVAFYSHSTPKNIYLAFRGSDYQIEVFDPDPHHARQLVEQGQIKPASPIAQTASTAPATASLAQLKALPAKLGHPVYWAGVQPPSKYELTQTASGRIFIRYLPRAASIGTAKPYLFVATFPVKDAFAATQRVANRADSVKVPVAGGVAFYARSSPTNLYLAFRGLDYQVEVFDLDGATARRLVRSGQVRPIP